MENKIEEGKKKFIIKYHIKTCVLSGINSSVCRSSAYSDKISKKQKKEFKDFWKEYLKDIIYPKYIQPQTLEEYIKDIIEFQRIMNEKFYPYFQHKNFTDDPGFRIAHAQKSISVFLKHLWCIDLIQEPPMCPIDRTVLREIGESSAWTKLNDINEYRRIVGIIKEQAEQREESICEWELRVFSKNT